MQAVDFSLVPHIPDSNAAKHSHTSHGKDESSTSNLPEDTVVLEPLATSFGVLHEFAVKQIEPGPFAWD
eukprot:1379035-Amphidinium_carterae.1